MKKHSIKQASHTGIEADHPAPKLHLVKGGSQPDDICEQLGLSHPNEMKPCSSETNKQEKSPEHLQAIEDVKLFREKKITATQLRMKYKESLNAYVHNVSYNPKGQELKVAWDDFQAFIEELWKP